MFELMSQVTLTADCEYDCNASLWLTSFFGASADRIIEELELDGPLADGVRVAELNGWKITSNQDYIQQTGKQDGQVVVTNSIPVIHQICLEHDLYDDA